MELKSSIPGQTSAPTGRPLASTYLRITQGLTTILKDKDLYKQLTSFNGAKAQALLNTFQTLLDDNSFHDDEGRHNLVIAMERLSSNTNLYPYGFRLEGVKLLTDEPHTGGAFADIYKGDFRGQVVCIKMLRLHNVHDVDQWKKIYTREAVVWRQHSHSNLLPFIGLYYLRSKLCFVSPWAEHGHVIQYLKQHPTSDRVLLILDIATGTHYLHKNRTIHGDLKGANILVSDSGRACVADFGLSSVSDSKIPQLTSQLSAASRGGTLRWQAPELHESSNDKAAANTTASDVYAWGCVCYEIFTGKIPFYDYTFDAAVLTVVAAGGRPTRPDESTQPWTDWGLAEDIWNLMVECWERDPRERPTFPNIISRISQGAAPDTRFVTSWPGTIRQSQDLGSHTQALAIIEGIIYPFDPPREPERAIHPQSRRESPHPHEDRNSRTHYIHHNPSGEYDNPLRNLFATLQEFLCSCTPYREQRIARALIGFIIVSIIVGLVVGLRYAPLSH